MPPKKRPKFKAKPKGAQQGTARPAVDVLSNAPSGGDSSDSDAGIADRDGTVSSQEDPAERISPEAMRQFISTMFKLTLRSPPESEWGGREGTIARIVKDCRLLPGSTSVVRAVLEATAAATAGGYEYDPRVKRGRGAKRKIDRGSADEALIVQYKEGGASFGTTTSILNRHRTEEGREHVGRSAVLGFAHSLGPQVRKRGKRAQGSKVKEDDWAQARWAWVLQLLIRFRRIVDVEQIRAEINRHRRELGVEELADSDPLPAYFDPAALEAGGFMLSIPEVTIWDETHFQVKSGGAGHSGIGSDMAWRFARDENGDVTDDPGASFARVKRANKFKYPPGEGRFALGVAVRFDEATGQQSGVRLKPWDYSGKTVVTPRVYKEAIEAQIAKTKAKAGKEGRCKWVTGGPADGELFTQDSTLRLAGVAKVGARKLADAGMHTVADVAEWSPGTEVAGFSQERMERLCTLAKSATAGACEPIVDLRRKDNPYKALYGKDWEEEISHTSGLSKLASVVDLAKHMVAETERIGATHFMHDALTLLVCNATQKVLEELDLLRYWVLPALGLNAEFTRYACMPPGNSPELNALDNYANKALKDCLHWHVSATVDLADTDPRKFSLRSHQEISRAVERLWDPALVGAEEGGAKASGIVRAFERVLEACKVVLAADGVHVEGCGNRTGNRKTVTVDSLKAGWGGRRTKESYNAGWFHADALRAIDERSAALRASREA
jgi:hypothetical protein